MEFRVILYRIEQFQRFMTLNKSFMADYITTLFFIIEVQIKLNKLVRFIVCPLRSH